MKKLLKKIVPKFIKDKYKKKKKADRHKGNAVYCPICKSSFNKFAPNGLIVRENARCHNCGSLERHRLLWKYLTDKVGFFKENKNIKILHFAPEKIFYTYLSRQNNIEYHPCDLTPENFNFNETTKILKADITNIPFEDNYFDFILCNHVLEHIPDDKKAMSELFRVMKKGAWGVFQAPINTESKTTYEDFSITSPEEREKAFGQVDHVRVYGLDYKDRLMKVGFNVNEDNYVNSFTSEEIYKFGFMPSEHIYNCSK